MRRFKSPHEHEHGVAFYMFPLAESVGCLWDGTEEMPKLFCQTATGGVEMSSLDLYRLEGKPKAVTRGAVTLTVNEGDLREELKMEPLPSTLRPPDDSDGDFILEDALRVEILGNDMSYADVIFGIFDASILPVLYSLDYFCKDLCLFFNKWKGYAMHLAAVICRTFDSKPSCSTLKATATALAALWRGWEGELFVCPVRSQAPSYGAGTIPYLWGRSWGGICVRGWGNKSLNGVVLKVVLENVVSEAAQEVYKWLQKLILAVVLRVLRDVTSLETGGLVEFTAELPRLHWRCGTLDTIEDWEDDLIECD